MTNYLPTVDRTATDMGESGMATRRTVGSSQRVVLLNLMDGDSRSAARIDNDQMMTPGTAYSALRGLWKRGLVERAFSYNVVEWHLTAKGTELAAELFPDGDDQ